MDHGTEFPEPFVWHEGFPAADDRAEHPLRNHQCGVDRRRQAQGDVTVTVGNLLLYPDKRQAEVGGVPLQLNRKEFDLLYYFVVNVNRVINKMSLAESVWGDNIDQADSLDFIYSQVKNLRKKLKQADASVELKAVYGFGYKLSEL